MDSTEITKEEFQSRRNVIVFTHLILDNALSGLLKTSVANPLNPEIKVKIKSQLQSLYKSRMERYFTDTLKSHIKMVYVFFTDGLEGVLQGKTLGELTEQKLKDVINGVVPKKHSDNISFIGISELRPVLAAVEVNFMGVDLAHFLLGKDGKGGYDTPKIAAALIQLARRDFQREEIFIRVDDDVEISSEGLVELKKKYYDLINDSSGKAFCISWNYGQFQFSSSNKGPGTKRIDFTEKLASSSPNGLDYQSLFRYFVNTYSIRTTFLADPSCICHFDPETLDLTLIGDEKDKCFLNLSHLKYFIELFANGNYGSDLSDVISGAGMCFSADSLIHLPPFCNSTELITWIDDFIKWELMGEFYGDRFNRVERMQFSDNKQGFIQNRKEPEAFQKKDVAWSTNIYLDRLLMGCIMSYFVNPRKYDKSSDSSAGLGQLLTEKDYPTALQIWKNQRCDDLKKGATNHVKEILKDWHFFFCAKGEESEPGYSDPNEVKTQTGFVPTPANVFFNSYVIKQLLIIEKEENFPLVEKVAQVIDRYLQLKYLFWPHIVAFIDQLRQGYLDSRRNERQQNHLLEPQGWLFKGLPDHSEPTPYVATRKSEAAVALIQNNNKEWLVQWNQNWQAMNLISGHVEQNMDGQPGVLSDPNPLACIIREIFEELFGELSAKDLKSMQKDVAETEKYELGSSKWENEYIQSVIPADRPRLSFIEYSKSKSQWTNYEFWVYKVKLTSKGDNKIFHEDPFYSPEQRRSPKNANEWISMDDIKRGWTKLGRPISKTVLKILGQ